MVSSIILLFLEYIGVVNTDVSLGFWKWFFLGLAIELTLDIIGLRQLDKWDLKTNYGRDRK
jgi:hypothetical protein